MTDEWEESVAACRVCKERLKAVEKALTDAAADAAPRAGTEEDATRPARVARAPEATSAAPGPAARGGFDGMDDDIPF